MSTRTGRDSGPGLAHALALAVGLLLEKHERPKGYGADQLATSSATYTRALSGAWPAQENDIVA